MGFDVGRTRDRSELAVFEEIEGRFVCRMLKSFEGAPFAAQEAELRRVLNTLPVARLSIDRSGIGMTRTVRSPRRGRSTVRTTEPKAE